VFCHPEAVAMRAWPDGGVAPLAPGVMAPSTRPPQAASGSNADLVILLGIV
jgi:hypothetical protein